MRENRKRIQLYHKCPYEECEFWTKTERLFDIWRPWWYLVYAKAGLSYSLTRRLTVCVLVHQKGGCASVCLSAICMLWRITKVACVWGFSLGTRAASQSKVGIHQHWHPPTSWSNLRFTPRVGGGRVCLPERGCLCVRGCERGFLTFANRKWGQPIWNFSCELYLIHYGEAEACLSMIRLLAEEMPN